MWTVWGRRGGLGSALRHSAAVPGAGTRRRAGSWQRLLRRQKAMGVLRPWGLWAPQGEKLHCSGTKKLAAAGAALAAIAFHPSCRCCLALLFLHPRPAAEGRGWCWFGASACAPAGSGGSSSGSGPPSPHTPPCGPPASASPAAGQQKVRPCLACRLPCQLWEQAVALCTCRARQSSGRPASCVSRTAECRPAGGSHGCAQRTWHWQLQ